MKGPSLLMGQYRQSESFVHRLDPRSKLLSVFIVALTLFFVASPPTLAVSACYFAAAIASSKVPLPVLAKSLKPIIWFVIAFALLQVIVTREGHLVFHLFGWPVYAEGLAEGGILAWRTLCLFLAATLLTMTTSPLHITWAIESLLKPLKAVKFPVSDLAMMMSITLRFIPILSGELHMISRAQAARGIGVRDQPFMKRVLAYMPLLVPLFVRSLKRAEELAQAMEARGYSRNRERSSWKTNQWAFKDTYALLVSATVAFLLAWF